MAFTSQTVSYLKNYEKTIKYKLEVRSSHPESSIWSEINILPGGFTIVRDRTQLGSTLIAQVPGENLLYFEEIEAANPLALFSEVRLTCQVGNEQGVLFLGFIVEIREEEGRFSLLAIDHCYRLMRSLCEIEVDGELTTEITNAPLYPLPDEFDNYTFGLRQEETPLGFSSVGKRRAWKPSVYKIVEAGKELSPDFYRVYPNSGVVRFLDPIPSSPVIESIHCYIEGTSDVSEAVSQALTYSRELGGQEY